MSRKIGALSPDNKEFCLAVAAFCDRHQISLRQLSDMCDGSRNRFSRSTAYRLINMDGVDDVVIDRVRPLIAAAFAHYLESRGHMPTEIETELSLIFDPKEFTKMIANRCQLSPEAIRFLGLNRDPFDVDHLPASDEIYTNPEIDAVVARVKDAVLYQRFIAIVGGVGTGKTLLKLRVAGELADNTKARLLYPEFWDMEELTVSNIATAILAELGQPIPRDKSQRVTKLRETLTQLQQEGIGVAVVLDECHRLRDKVISSLKNFWEMTNGTSSRLLGVILFGQPAFVDARLRDTRFKEIRQRVQIIDMPQLSSSSTAYIAHRLSLAGGSIDTLFDPKAIERICLNAQTPLAIGNLCNEAMMEAYHLEEKRVSVSFEFFKKLSTGQQVLGMRRSAA